MCVSWDTCCSGDLAKKCPQKRTETCYPEYVSSRNILHHLNVCILHLTPSKNGGISSGNKKTLGSRFTNYLPSSRLQQQNPTSRSHHLNRQTAQCALILQTCPRIKASRSNNLVPNKHIQNRNPNPVKKNRELLTPLPSTTPHNVMLIPD
jgi:hypothetical protein